MKISNEDSVTRHWHTFHAEEETKGTLIEIQKIYAQVDRFSQTLSEMKLSRSLLEIIVKATHSLIPRWEQSICPPFVIKHARLFSGFEENAQNSMWRCHPIGK